MILQIFFEAFVYSIGAEWGDCKLYDECADLRNLASRDGPASVLYQHMGMSNKIVDSKNKTYYR